MKLALVTQQGFHASIQDLGRKGYRHLGIGMGGPMDLFAFSMANALVGNARELPVMEMTGGGFEIKILANSIMALTGFGQIRLDGESIPLWRPFKVSEGQILQIGRSPEGQWAYLAVAGGWQGDEWLGSRSTHIAAKAGGYLGRMLMKEDVLHLGSDPGEFSMKIGASIKKVYANWGLSEKAFPYSKPAIIRLVEGPEADWLEEECLKNLTTAQCYISPASSRMGYKLNGPEMLFREKDRQLLSKAVCPGNIQVTPDGSMFVLMADAQTTGGYPRIAHVVTADLPALAQLKPGSRLLFKQVTHEVALQMLMQAESDIQAIFQEITDRFS
jgi:antagonist of KipI